MKFDRLLKPRLYWKRRDREMLLGALVLSLVANLVFWLVLGDAALLAALPVNLVLFGCAWAYLVRRDEAMRIYEHDVASNYAQIESLFSLYHTVGFDHPLPRFRNWAVSPDCCVELVREILENDYRTIVECGSGISTIVIARTLSRVGGGHVYSLESSEHYAEETRRMLRLHRLEDYSTVITAPLGETRVGSEQFEWYEVAGLEGLPDSIDLLFIDGPPGPPACLPDTRFPAFPLLQDRLARQSTVVLDDFVREGEKGVVRRWLNETTGFDIHKTEVANEKGTCILKCTRQDSGSNPG